MVAFFTDVIGLVVGERPDFGFPGEWLYAGEDAAVHLVFGVDSDPMEPTSLTNHVAFWTDDRSGLLERMAAAGVDPSKISMRTEGVEQIFIPGPEGLVVEMRVPAPGD